MKTSSIPTILSLFIITLVLNSCTKEAGIKEAPKLSTADCPRLASLTAEKKETLYTVSTFAGVDQLYNSRVVDGVLCKARFGLAGGIAITPDGTIYISDSGIHNIRKISTKGIVSTLAGEPRGGGFCLGNDDGIGPEALFCSPTEVVINKESNLFLVESNGLGSVRKINPTALVSTIISNYRLEGYQDGILAQAKFGIFRTLALNPDGDIFIYDYTNNVIRKISTSELVTTYAGEKPVLGLPVRGYKDGPKETALFGGLSDMTFTPDGSLYLCDVGNKKIRRITPAGVVETISDIAAEAYSIAVSDKGIILAATGQQIYKIDLNGTSQVIAGSKTSEYKDGVGTQAHFRDLKQMAIYKNYLYLTDGSTVRRMNIE